MTTAAMVLSTISLALASGRVVKHVDKLAGRLPIQYNKINIFLSLFCERWVERNEKALRKKYES
jgi:hypothetical protein